MARDGSAASTDRPSSPEVATPTSLVIVGTSGTEETECLEHQMPKTVRKSGAVAAPPSSGRPSISSVARSSE